MTRPRGREGRYAKRRASSRWTPISSRGCKCPSKAPCQRRLVTWNIQSSAGQPSAFCAVDGVTCEGHVTGAANPLIMRNTEVFMILLRPFRLISCLSFQGRKRFLQFNQTVTSITLIAVFPCYSIKRAKCSTRRRPWLTACLPLRKLPQLRFKRVLSWFPSAQLPWPRCTASRSFIFDSNLLSACALKSGLPPENSIRCPPRASHNAV